MYSVNYNRIVIKIGTTSLTHKNGKINLQRIEEICRIISDLKKLGKEIILVTSAAIAAGMDHLNIAERPRDIVGKQVASAVGQVILMQIYQKFFSLYGFCIGQVLLTNDVIDDDLRKQNAKNTFNELIKLGIIPIVNANDAIAIDELDEKISDNDKLSAYVSFITDSDLLVIFSDIEGLYDADPNVNSHAKIIPKVSEISEEIKKLATGSVNKLGTGGMVTKLQAATICMNNNINLVIAKGNMPSLLLDIVNGKNVGTLFSKY